MTQAGGLNRTGFRRALLRWYDSSRRDLPWRESNDFYGVWISEVMLQQTRVEAVIPYYRRFLERFPSVESLAGALEDAVLTAWSGLGYYSRARALHRAAKQLAAQRLPITYAEVLSLPGAGPYTAAAIASIALNLPHAAVDGNVIRVISRLTNNASEITSVAARRDFTYTATALLDRQRPGDFNQAMMELGATICLPRTPDCGACPVEKFCAARTAGTERELPVKLRKQKARDVPLDLALVRAGMPGGDRRIFLVKRSSSERRLADFWELPERHLVPGLRGKLLGEFSHRIVNDRFRIRLFGMELHRGQIARTPPSRFPPGNWFGVPDLNEIPLTTITKKALATAFSTASITQANREI
ncbi:MAG: A/G-specific adenine glycosylase [Bryobacteraceae bacterium]